MVYYIEHDEYKVTDKKDICIYVGLDMKKRLKDIPSRPDKSFHSSLTSDPAHISIVVCLFLAYVRAISSLPLIAGKKRWFSRRHRVLASGNSNGRDIVCVTVPHPTRHHVGRHKHRRIKRCTLLTFEIYIYQRVNISIDIYEIHAPQATPAQNLISFTSYSLRWFTRSIALVPDSIGPEGAYIFVVLWGKMGKR